MIDWARLLSLVKLTYNNTKNINISYTFYNFNCDYHPCVFFEDDANSCLRYCSAKKPAKKMRSDINLPVSKRAKKSDVDLLLRSTLCSKIIKVSIC